MAARKPTTEAEASVAAQKAAGPANDRENMKPTSPEASPGEPKETVTKVVLPGQHGVKEPVELTIVNR